MSDLVPGSRSKESDISTDLHQAFERLERILFGKIGNTFEANQMIAVHALLLDVFDRGQRAGRRSATLDDADLITAERSSVAEAAGILLAALGWSSGGLAAAAEEVVARLAQIQRERDDASRDRDAWKDAVLDATVVDWIYTKEHETDPRKAVNDLLVWQQQVALNPAVSKTAYDLVERAEQAEQERKSADVLLHRVCVAMDETSPAEAVEQLEFDQQSWQAACDAIKQGESWPPLSYPSMRDRWIYAALVRRAEQAERERDEARAALAEALSGSRE